MPKTFPSCAEVLDILHEIAPLELAAEWDNVGLLVEPQQRRQQVARVLLAIDLTEAVVAEAKSLRADLVVSYHPPIFRGLQRLTAADGRQRVLLRALAGDFAVYSPHTALDAAPGGIAEWLAEGMLAGEAPAELRPCGEGEFGRVVVLDRPVAFAQLVQRCKKLLGLRALQVALPAKRPGRLRSLAVAAGAGGSVLRASKAELWLTGELSHHDALAATANGTTVLVAGHSRTERPYLRVLQKRLSRAFAGDLSVHISKADRDPWQVI